MTAQKSVSHKYKEKTPVLQFCEVGFYRMSIIALYDWDVAFD